jgi:hypothetical protein
VLGPGQPFVLEDCRFPPGAAFTPFFSVRTGVQTAVGFVNLHTWWPFPSCGWERQLSEANKPVVLVHPVPHDTAFDDAVGLHSLALLDAVIRTLWSDSHVGQSLASGVTLGKTAVGGFSFGGDELFVMFNQVVPPPKDNPKAKAVKNSDKIDELYLFDVNGFDAHTADVTAWFKTGGKKLRMVGGMLHTSMLALAKTLGSPDATVKPDKADFWQTNDLYQDAVNLDEFSPSTAATPNAFSSKVRMFESTRTRGNTAVVLEGRDAKGKSVGTGEILLCSTREAAGMIEVIPLTPKKSVPKGCPISIIPVKTADDLTNNLNVARFTVKWVRHQWAVCGGDDSTNRRDRGTGFKGYLQQCLEQSGF